MPENQQLRLPLGKVNMTQFAPVPVAQAGARVYAKASGRPYSQKGLANTRADPTQGFRMAQAFGHSVNSGPQSSPGIDRSYEALRQDIRSQHDFMTRPREQGGMGITHEVVPHDPYPAEGTDRYVFHNAMAHDVGTNRRIKTLATSTTAEADRGATHQALSNEDNDKFRAVHDVFGHAATGRGFSRDGEEAAYRSHIQMFSPQARQAATAELRGQNSYLNYSPQGGFPDTQGRAVGMPDWAQRTPFTDRRRV